MQIPAEADYSSYEYLFICAKESESPGCFPIGGRPYQGHGETVGDGMIGSRQTMDMGASGAHRIVRARDLIDGPHLIPRHEERQRSDQARPAASGALHRTCVTVTEIRRLSDREAVITEIAGDHPWSDADSIGADRLAEQERLMSLYQQTLPGTLEHVRRRATKPVDLARHQGKA